MRFRFRRGRRDGRRASVPTITRTFRDDELQRRFETTGWVVTPLLEPGELDALLGEYRELEHHHERWLPFAEGFHTTIYDERDDYRISVGDAFDRHLAPALDRVLADHRIQFANFQVKLPGAEFLPEHIDWTFVDESRARSVTVWCATGAIDGSNGGLGVIEGTHERVDFIRAVNHRFYERHSAVAGPDAERTVLSLRPGEAVVFDNRLLHFSTPNRSDGPRLAASCVATPRSEPVVHYWFDDEEAAHRLEVDPEFWLHYRIGTDPRGVSGVRSDDVVVGTFA